MHFFAFFCEKICKTLFVHHIFASSIKTPPIYDSITSQSPIQNLYIMKIILNPKCQSITGIIDPHHGYYILQTQKGFFIKKNKHHPPPPHTHWQLILTFAQHAYLNTHIQDIEVSQSELILALYHAKLLHLTPYTRVVDVKNSSGTLKGVLAALIHTTKKMVMDHPFVEERRLERPTPTSRTWCATNCATPRKRVQKYYFFLTYPNNQRKNMLFFLKTAFRFLFFGRLCHQCTSIRFRHERYIYFLRNREIPF